MRYELSIRRDAGGSNPPLSIALSGDGHRTHRDYRDQTHSRWHRSRYGCSVPPPGGSPR
jgi:hypothetical protein